MKKKVILLASFAIIAGSSVLFALNNKNTASTGDCCKQKSSCSAQSCGTECACDGDCTGENCECGCSCCK